MPASPFPRTIAWLRRLANDLLELPGLPRKLALARRVREDMATARRFFLPGDRPTPDGLTVVFASFVPLPYLIKIEGLLSKALRDRGYRPLCLHSDYSRLASRYHRTVFGNPSRNLAEFIPWDRHAALWRLTAETVYKPLADIKAFAHVGVPVGMHALASLSAGDAGGRLDLDAASRRRLHRLLLRSCLLAEAAPAFLEATRPRLVVAVEKGFVENCEIFHAAVNAGVDYVQWHNCHEPESIMLKRYHAGNRRAHPFSISAATWKRALAEPWHEAIAETVLREFRDGYLGHKWFAYKKLTAASQEISRQTLTERYGLDPDKKTAVIFSPILNDANLFYGQDLFDGGFAQWLVETVRAARDNPRVNWILKLHPANRFRRELSGYTGEYGEILALKEAFGEVPPAVRVMRPQDNVNPYFLFQCIDYGLTVRGTVGAEMPCFGVPALTGGTGRYSGLGFTEDSDSAADYLAKVRAIETIPPVAPERVRLALRHAYLFFKIRPAKYDTYASDIAADRRTAGPFFWDIRFKARTYRELLDNPQLSRVVDWLVASDEEDCLGPAATPGDEPA